MRILFLVFGCFLIARSETVSGSKLLPGGAGASVGVLALDGNQSFGPENLTYRSLVFPGAHTLTSNAPAGFAVAYSVCVNCQNHPAASFVPGIVAEIVVPINGAVDISWLYTPAPGTLRGSRVLPDGSPFLNASVTVDATQTIAGGVSSYTSAVSFGAHSVASSVPAGYSVSYSTCTNCTDHPASSFVAGSTASVNVPPDGYVDIRFQYAPVSASPVSLATPFPNQTVTGNLALSVSGAGLAKVSSVEYSIGSNRLARISASSANPAFQANWNSALAADGVSQIEMTAFDYVDNIVFRDTRPIALSNYSNAASASLPAQLSGTVPIALTGLDKTHFPAYWQVFFDGEIAPGAAGLLFSDQDGLHQNSRSTTIDTTAYPNGRHEFHMAFHSTDYPAASTEGAGYDFRGMVTQNVNIDNGRAPMEILPNYLFAYTPVGAGLQLTCTRLYTDGYRAPCSAPRYTVDGAASSAGFQVSAAGLVTGSAEGYGDVVVTEAGKSATVHVWIRNSPGLPHFQDAGKYGNTYLAGKSLFAVAAFQLSPDRLMSDPALLAEVRRTGINTLNKGIYLPNSDTALAFTAWKEKFDTGSYASAWNWSLANGFRVLGSGDDIVRRPGSEGSWISNWPGAPLAVGYAMEQFAQSGAGLSLDVVDESSALWGSNPTPAGIIGGAHAMQSAACAGTQCVFTWPSLLDPAENTFHDALAPKRSFVIAGTSPLTTPAGKASTINAVTGTQVTFTNPITISGSRTFDAANSPNLEFLWFSGAVPCQNNTMCNPPLSNQLLTNVASWLRSASSTVPISWPPTGAALPYVHRNWMKDGGISDYPSHYWDSNQQRRTYPFGMGARENQNSMLTAFLGRQTFLNPNRPQLLQQSMSGISYLKFSPAGTAVYSPPVDQLTHVGQTPKAVTSGIMTAAAAGAAGVKLYKFDTTATERRDAKGDGSEYDSDAGPLTGEVLNWQAMGYASRLLSKSLPDYLLGQPVNSPYLGRNIITGARRADSGNLLMVVNGWDGTRTVTIDLTPFRTGSSILRYLASDVAIKLRLLGDTPADTVTLAGGETAIYVVPKAAAVNGVDTVTFQPDASGASTLLRTNYLYSQNTTGFGDPVDCSLGCSVPVDRKLGDAFYSYAVLDAGGAAQCRSAAINIPAGTTVSLAAAPQTRNPNCR